MLTIKDIKGGYTQGSMILQGISFTIEKGEIVGIIGLNGCGKSTLGKAVMNMLPFREGKIWFNGKDISDLSTHRMKETGISMVLQGGRTFPMMTVKEHLQLAGNIKSDNELKSRIAQVAEHYGVAIISQDLPMSRKANLLSGGEKQKLALAMALMNRPEFMILDEISAGLSPVNQETVTASLEKIKASKAIGIMLIEQNIRLATRLADKLLLLERGIIDKTFKIDANFDINQLNENIFN